LSWYPFRKREHAKLNQTPKITERGYDAGPNTASFREGKKGEEKGGEVAS
jgi:hypothetical protein